MKSAGEPFDLWAVWLVFASVVLGQEFFNQVIDRMGFDREAKGL